MYTKQINAHHPELQCIPNKMRLTTTLKSSHRLNGGGEFLRFCHSFGGPPPNNYILRITCCTTSVKPASPSNPCTSRCPKICWVTYEIQSGGIKIAWSSKRQIAARQLSHFEAHFDYREGHFTPLLLHKLSCKLTTHQVGNLHQVPWWKTRMPFNFPSSCGVTIRE